MFRGIFSSFSQYKGLPREIYILALQRFINSIGGFVHPFLLLFLTERIGLTKDVAGIYMTISAGLGIPGALIAGHLADRYNRKYIIIISRTLCALLFIACGFLGNSMIVTYLIMLSSVIWSFSGPASGAMTSDLTTPENRKQSFSLMYLCMNVGLAFGFAMAGVLFKHYTRWLFWGDGITSLLSLLLVVFFIKDTKPSREQIDAINNSKRDGEKEEKTNIFVALLRRPFLVGFVFVNSIIGFVYFQHGFVMQLHLKELFADDGAPLFSSIMIVNTIIVIIFTPFLMHITRKIKPIVNVGIATITYIIGFGMLAFANTLWPFYVAVFIWTTGEIIAMANTGVYISNHSPVNHRGRFNSMIGIIQSSGRALSPALMGIFLVGRTNSAGWILTAGVAGVALLLLILLYTKEQQHKKREQRQVVLQEEGVA